MSAQPAPRFWSRSLATLVKRTAELAAVVTTPLRIRVPQFAVTLD
jgi:hypothetical protein